MAHLDKFSGLQSLQSRLSVRFFELSNARPNNPVFLIEHGLTNDEVQKLFDIVGYHLRHVGVDRGFWHQTSLPLLVAASEVGYRYRGTGTEYWPMFDSFLGVHLLLSDRKELSMIFDFSHSKYRIRKPENTKWTKAYKHIAWPITNALVPVEIHRPLSRAVQIVVNNEIKISDDELLLEKLRKVASGLWSRRLTEWLVDGGTATEVVRNLLSEKQSDSWISSEIIDRISHDIQSDNVAYKAFSYARKKLTRRDRKQKVLPESARLALVMNGLRPKQLALVGPRINKEIREKITGLLDFSIVPQRNDKATGLDYFLSGGSIFIGSTGNIPDNPFFIYKDDKSMDYERDFCTALEPKLAYPLLFEIDQNSEIAIAQDTKLPLNTSRSYIATNWFFDLEALDQDKKKTAWPNFDYCLLDYSNAQDRQWMEQRGFLFDQGVDIQILGGLPLEQSADQLILASGIPLIIRTNKNATTLTQHNTITGEKSSITLEMGEQAIVEFEPGEYVLEILQGGHTRQIHILVSKQEYHEVFSLKTSPVAPFADDFLSKDVTLDLRSLIPLDNIEVVVTVYASGTEIGRTTTKIETFPAKIGAQSSMMKKLGEKIAGQSSTRSEALRLRVTIPGLVEQEWQLPWRARPFSFNSDSNLWFVESDKHMPINSRFATADNPFLTRATGNTVTMDSSIVLHTPDVDDDEALLCGICTGSETYTLGEQMTWRSQRLLRQINSRQQAIGIMPVLTSYFAWKLASSSNIVINHIRQKVADKLEMIAVEQLCGGAWRQKENLSPIDIFLSIAKKKKLVVDDECSKDMSAENILAVEQKRKKLFLNLLPDLQAALHSMNEDFAEQLNDAAMDAYEQVRNVDLQVGQETFEEPDIWYETDVWSEALKEALVYRDLIMFAPFILPTERWADLQQLNYAQASEDDVIDALEACHVDINRRQGFQWLKRHDFRIGMQIWLSPRSVLETAEWRDCINRLLSDRQTARAIRYVALRTQAAKGVEKLHQGKGSSF